MFSAGTILLVWFMGVMMGIVVAVVLRLIYDSNEKCPDCGQKPWARK